MYCCKVDSLFCCVFVKDVVIVYYYNKMMWFLSNKVNKCGLILFGWGELD